MKVFKKTQIHFPRKLLNELKNDAESCVTVERKSSHLSMHPFRFNDISGSIKELLNNGIAKYSKEFDGILLGYQNIKVHDSAMPILDDNCFAHVNIEADVFLFKPRVDKQLRGIVSKRSQNHIGCLVHNVFNVSLPKPNDVENWIGDKVSIGNEVSFRVTYVDLEGRLPYIRADLIAIHGGNAVDDLDSNVMSCHGGQRQKITFEAGEEDADYYDEKKEVGFVQQTTQEADEVLTNHDELNDSSFSRRKKSKRKSEESKAEPLEEVVTPKKKRKKNDLDDMKNMLLEETVKTLTKDVKNPRRKRKLSEALQESIHSDGTDLEPKKKKRKKKDVDIELSLTQMADSLLQESVASRLGNSKSESKETKNRRKEKETLFEPKIEQRLQEETGEQTPPKKSKKKKNKTFNEDIELNLTQMADSLLQESIASRLERVDTSTLTIKNAKNRGIKKNRQLEPIAKSEERFQEQTGEQKLLKKSKKKKDKSPEEDIELSLTQMTDSLLQESIDSRLGGADNNNKPKTKDQKKSKQKKSKSSIDIDELSDSILQETLNKQNAAESQTNLPPKLNGYLSKQPENTERKKRKGKSDNLDALTDQLLQESLKHVNDKDAEKGKPKNSSSKKKANKSKAEDDLNIEALFQDEMKSIMS